MTTIKTELKATVREVPADLETPVSAFLKLKGHGARFLLESVEMGENLGRYSFIGLDSLRSFKVLADEVHVEEGGVVRKSPIAGRNPLELLRQLMAPLAIRHDSLPGLVGGAVGYLGYDFVRFIERLIRLRLATPQDRFRDDNRGIDDDPKIDRAKGQQVRWYLQKVHHDENRYQGERDSDADNQGAAETAEKEQEHYQDQADPLQNCVRDLADRLSDEVGAVVVGHDAHVLGCQALVEFANLGMDAF